MILSPIPGSTRDKNDGGYPADSGLDILVPVGTACVAVANGVLVYSEEGHTPWIEDTDRAKPGFQPPHSILLELDEPFTVGGLTVRYAWYTHLTSVVHQVGDGGNKRVRAGEVIGRSGIGNGVPHLHFGLLSNRAQKDGQFLSCYQVADIIWPRVPVPARPAPAKHEPQHRIKMFVNQGRTRAFNDGTEAVVMDFHASRKADGSMVVTVNGLPVKPVGLHLDLAFE